MTKDGVQALAGPGRLLVDMYTRHMCRKMHKLMEKQFTWVGVRGRALAEGWQCLRLLVNIYTRHMRRKRHKLTEKQFTWLCVR
jgi:hypothetical protein